MATSKSGVTPTQVLSMFLMKIPQGISAGGTIRIQNRLFIVNEEVLAAWSRADNIYVNMEHPDDLALERVLATAPRDKVHKVGAKELAEILEAMGETPCISTAPVV